MFTKIELNNFQSHKHTVLEFSKGVNTIIGESDNGKTAIIRAMMWVLRNRPSGTEKINSRWNDGFKKPMSVKIHTENGWIERKREKKFNGYVIFKDGKEIVLEAIGKDVPSEVEEFFRMNDVNTQLQMDSPYLLSLTPGEASKYLNKVVNLDSIDEVLSHAESQKRELSAEEKIINKDITDIKLRLENTSWVDEAMQLQKRIDKYDEDLQKINGKIEGLKNTINSFELYRNCIVDLTKQKKIVDEIDNIPTVNTLILQQEINSFEKSKDSVVDTSDFSIMVNEIENIKTVSDDVLEDDIWLMERLKEEYDSEIEEIKNLKSEMPAVCPYCGNPLKGGEECFKKIS
ncbi:MAG: AAA family ATPase [Paludibacteraceae bacterium]|nr:AAA family ATPase [Paludibacteraceae bacterium]